MRQHTPFRHRTAVVLLLIATLFLSGPGSAFAEMTERETGSESWDNPLITPYTYTPLSREDNPGLINKINILLLGFDADYKTYAQDGGESHSDAMMLVSLDTETGGVDLITLPRDTLTYVPGVRGMYKLNGAVNAGGGKTTDTGLEKACEAASILLGNVPIDYYFAIEMEKVVDVVDLLGGIDIDVTYGFSTRDGRRFTTGTHHLDGEAVYSYTRFRKTLEGTDVKRTRKQRAVIAALMQKIQQDNLYLKIPEILDSIKDGYYTNINAIAVLALLPIAMKADTDDIETYTVGGQLHPSLNGWNINFLDQDARIELLNELFGITASPLRYCSADYCAWLVGNGEAGNGALGALRYLYVADHVLVYAQSLASTDETIVAGIEALTTAEKNVKTLFCQTADAVNDAADGDYDSDGTARALNGELADAKAKLCAAAETLTEATGFPGDTGQSRLGQGELKWVYQVRWETDPSINEVYVNFH